MIELKDRPDSADRTALLAIVRNRFRESCTKLRLEVVPVLQQFDAHRYAEDTIIEMSIWPDEAIAAHCRFLDEERLAGASSDRHASPESINGCSCTAKLSPLDLEAISDEVQVVEQAICEALGDRYDPLEWVVWVDFAATLSYLLRRDASPSTLHLAEPEGRHQKPSLATTARASAPVFQFMPTSLRRH